MQKAYAAEHMPFLWLNIKQIRNIKEVDAQIIIDTDLYRIREGIITGILRCKIIYSNAFFPGQQSNIRERRLCGT